MYDARNSQMKFYDDTINYVSFGYGNKNLLLIPGLNTERIKGKALQLAFYYRNFLRDYKVFIFDHKEHLNENYEISDMAEEIAYCIKKLNLDKVDVVGVSQGGMIAQLLAINYPDIVRKLVLVTTTSRNNPTTNKVVDRWIVLAENGELQELQKNMLETVYSKRYIAKNKWLSILVQFLFKPRLDQLNRFIILARSCLKFNVFDKLDKIQSKTLVIGAALDQVIPVEFSNELAEKINCQKIIFENSGHAVHQEVSDFNRTVLNFLISSN